MNCAFRFMNYLIPLHRLHECLCLREGVFSPDSSSLLNNRTVFWIVEKFMVEVKGSLGVKCLIGNMRLEFSILFDADTLNRTIARLGRFADFPPLLCVDTTA